MTDSTPLGEILDEIEQLICRYVAFPEPSQPIAVVLWVAHSWAFEYAEATPYLAVTGPERRTGKTRLLEVLELLVREPMFASSITPAALFRAINAKQPTLLLDEVDAVFGPKANGNEELRAVLNAGHRRGAKVVRMGGPRMTELQSFPVFCPKVLAGIGKLPDTIADRSVPVRMQRKTPTEPVARFRRRLAAAEAEPWRFALDEALRGHGGFLDTHEPELPDELNDRAADGWEPLLAIADAAGGHWPARARDAAVAIHTGEHRDDDSLGVRLLADINTVLTDASRPEKIATSILLDALHKLEEAPWGDFKGRPLAARTLARILSNYDVRSAKLRVGDATFRGYRLSDLEPAFARYLGLYPEHPEQANESLAETTEMQVEHDADVPDSKPAKKPISIGDVPHVPDKPPKIGAAGYYDPLFGELPGGAS